jgi:hypothetical protein
MPELPPDGRRIRTQIHFGPIRPDGPNKSKIMKTTVWPIPTPVLAASCFLLSACASGAFYNPSTGRWLSRDPIQEAGFASRRGHFVHAGSPFDGPNIYAFLMNATPSRVDYLGLRTCCCKGKVIDGTPVVVMKYCTGRSPSGDWDHAWIEMDGSSAGFYPREGSVGLWAGGIPVDVPGQVDIPESGYYLNHSGKVCREIKVSPCDYNIQAYQGRIWAQIWWEHFNPPRYNVVFNNCFQWADSLNRWGWGIGNHFNLKGCGNDPHEFQ